MHELKLKQKGEKDTAAQNHQRKQMKVLKTEVDCTLFSTSFEAIFINV